MSDPLPRLYLAPPAAPDLDAFLPRLDAVLAAVPAAAVLVRLASRDARQQVNDTKRWAAVVQARDAALILAASDLADPVATAVRGGADGLHGDAAAARALRDALPADRTLGIGGLRTRDDAMAAGEAGADYLLFGEPRPDGFVPPLDRTEERAAWWAEIFETPCVAYAPDLEAVALLAGTGAEFVLAGAWLWDDGRGAVAAAEDAARRLGAGASARVPA